MTPTALAPDFVTPLRVFSFGGGVQSTAALVLAARGEIDCRTFFYANVGDDAEPDTLAYIAAHAKPFAESAGFELTELRKKLRGGTPDTLTERINRVKSTVPIPMRMDRNGAVGNRTCTAEFKIRVVYNELRRRGATRAQPAVVLLGISLDEYQRMKTPYDKRVPAQRREYPLIALQLDKQDCLNIIASAGLPEPPKSACYWCPFHSIEQWRRLKRAHPDRFAASVALEAQMQDRRTALGLDPVWMTDRGVRDRLTLDKVIGDDGQLTIDEGAACDEGYCFT